MPRDVFPRTISRGPLAGERFESKWAYQQARAQRLGFTSYGAERSAKTNPAFTVVQQRAQSRGYTRAAAINAARRIIGNERIPKGQRQGRASTRSAQERARMREVIAQLYNEGIYDNGDDAADDLYYE